MVKKSFLSVFQSAVCAYMVLLMAIYWVTEALPLGVTGLIPLFLSPMLGIMSLNDVAPNYMKVNSIFRKLAMYLRLNDCKFHRLSITL